MCRAAACTSPSIIRDGHEEALYVSPEALTTPAFSLAAMRLTSPPSSYPTPSFAQHRDVARKASCGATFKRFKFPPP